jgi:site-specific recombinase XerD
MGMRQLKHVQSLYEMVDTDHMGHNKWKTYIDAFLFGCRVNNLTDASINSYAERVRYLVRYLTERGIDIEDVTRTHLQEYIMTMVGTMADATVNGRIQVMQRFWNYLEEEGIWTKPNPMHKIKRIKAEKKVKDVVSPEDIEQVIGKVNKRTFVGYRNMTMLMMFFDTMIRRNELVTLTLENVDLHAGRIRVFGKGRKWREVGMGARMTKTLHFYLKRYREDLPGDLVFARVTAINSTRTMSGISFSEWANEPEFICTRTFSGTLRQLGSFRTAAPRLSCSESSAIPRQS